MRRFICLSIIAISFCAFQRSNAVDVATDPVGFLTKSCLANTDTIVSPPFTRLPEFIGAISSVSGNTITVSGSPWAASQFVYAAGTQPNTYYALIGPHSSANPNEGRIYPITANTTNTLTVNLNGDSISAVQSNTQLLVIPYWTLGTVFPSADQNVSFIPTSSQFNLQTQVLTPNYSGTGINRSSSFTYFFFNGAWRRFDRPATESHDDDILQPTGYFTLRNPGTPTNLTTLGSVLVKKETIPLATQTGGQQDNFVSVARPVDVKLNDLGLITSNAFTTTTSLFSLADQLLVFNNAATGINKSSSATYIYYQGHWANFSSPNTDAGNDVIPAGHGFIIRKAATGNGATQFWINAPTY